MFVGKLFSCIALVFTIGSISCNNQTTSDTNAAVSKDTAAVNAADPLTKLE